jgi:hypothetical protein
VLPRRPTPIALLTGFIGILAFFAQTSSEVAMELLLHRQLNHRASFHVQEVTRPWNTHQRIEPSHCNRPWSIAMLEL